MEINTLFFERLKYLQESSNKSFNQIERELGYSRNAMSNYKKCKAPSGYRLIELSRYFGVSPEYLLGLDKDLNRVNVKLVFEQLNSVQKQAMYALCSDWIISQIRD